MDKFVIGDLNYHTSLLLATVESHVFKFADRAALDFQCAINICLKNENGCEGITVNETGFESESEYSYILIRFSRPDASDFRNEISETIPNQTRPLYKICPTIGIYMLNG